MKFVLIDLSSIVYPFFYGIQAKNKNNESISAIYGFINMFKNKIQYINPDYIAICDDVERKTLKRKEWFPAYKEKRQPTPVELIEQVKVIYNFLKKLNINIIKLEGYEADDVINSFVKKFHDVDFYIFTSDKDLLQLVSKNIKVISKRKGKTLIFDTEEKVKEHIGVYPKQIVDFLSLIGDRSDNIPGITGIGQKRGEYLINNFHSIKGIYDNIFKLDYKLRNILISEKNDLDLYVKLISLLEFNLNKEIEEFKFKFNFEEIEIVSKEIYL